MIPLFKNNPSLCSILPPLPFLWQKFELPFLKKLWIQKATDLTLSLRLPSYSVRIIGELIQILNNITITPYWMFKQLNPKIKISENMVHSFKKKLSFFIPYINFDSGQVFSTSKNVNSKGNRLNFIIEASELLRQNHRRIDTNT